MWINIIKLQQSPRNSLISNLNVGPDTEPKTQGEFHINSTLSTLYNLHAPSPWDLSPNYPGRYGAFRQHKQNMDIQTMMKRFTTRYELPTKSISIKHHLDKMVDFSMNLSISSMIFGGSFPALLPLFPHPFPMKPPWPHVPRWNSTAPLRASPKPRFNRVFFFCWLWFWIPSRELTYPTLGKGKSSSKSQFLGDMLIPWRVIQKKKRELL